MMRKKKALLGTFLRRLNLPLELSEDEGFLTFFKDALDRRRSEEELKKVAKIFVPLREVVPKEVPLDVLQRILSYL